MERRHPIRDWVARRGLGLARRRTEREARAFDDAPRLSVRWPWSRRDAPRHGDQVLRAFVQINVLPRPR